MLYSDHLQRPEVICSISFSEQSLFDIPLHKIYEIKEVKLKKRHHKGDILYFFAKVAILLHYSFYNKKINKLHKSCR
jgi:hypothetical protein